MATRSTSTEEGLRKTICEFLRLFYVKEWVAGTGGGICTRVKGHQVLMAPTGVHKERVMSHDLFLVDYRNGKIIQSPRRRHLRLTECSTIFCLLISQRGAGAVLHSHALSSVLAADLATGGDRVIFQDLEMLKGLRGITNLDRLLVPVIQNKPREPELVDQIEKVVNNPDFSRSPCILVRDHGAYIWGEEVWETKRHAEVFHFLFEAAVARSKKDGL